MGRKSTGVKSPWGEKSTGRKSTGAKSTGESPRGEGPRGESRRPPYFYFDLLCLHDDLAWSKGPRRSKHFLSAKTQKWPDDGLWMRLDTESISRKGTFIIEGLVTFGTIRCMVSARGYKR